jgi:hypothetical protein
VTDAEVEAADDWHWVSIGEACDRLLARLQNFHTDKPAPEGQTNETEV